MNSESQKLQDGNKQGEMIMRTVCVCLLAGRGFGMDCFFCRWSGQGRLLEEAIFQTKYQRIESVLCKGLGKSFLVENRKCKDIRVGRSRCVGWTERAH